MARLLTWFSLFLLISLLLPKAVFAVSSATLSNNLVFQDGQKFRRVVILYNFLDNYNSPLKNYALNFVEDADKYKLDYRLLAAISGVESTFGQQLPYNSYNAWGWGIYGDNMIRFNSYPEAITSISKSLRENYIDNWKAQNVYQIGRFYAASPTWAQRVVYFMGKIEPESLPLSL